MVSHAEKSLATQKAQKSSAGVRRVVIAGVAGTVIEYFDFLVYATVSGLVFRQLFFPGEDEFAGTLLAISTFSVGYLMRPLGAIIFGHFGDKLGRRRALFVSLTMMGIATLLIGLLPTYATVGIAAPIALVVIRIVQGIAVGGEYGGATTLVLEHTNHTGRRGLFGSMIAASSSAGLLIASAVLAVLTGLTTDEQFEAWAWRIPFLMSAGLVFIALYIRLKIEESPIIKEAVRQHNTVSLPIVEIFQRYRRQLLITLLVPVGTFVIYNTMVAFSVPYAVRISGMSNSRILTMLTLAQVFYVASVIFWGWFSDRVGRRIPMLAGACGLVVWGFAFFPLLLSRSAVGVFFAFVVALVFVAGVYGPQSAFFAEMFGPGVRVTGVSLGYQITAAIVGGLTPIAAAALVGTTGSWLPVAVMISVAAAVSVITLVLSRETAWVDLGEQRRSPLDA